jgi:succinyl-CoA synthetase beta subunit
MKLYECEAKAIFNEYGIPVPKSTVITKDTNLAHALDDISFPVALKSQVLTGGRGHAGGIKFAENKEEARKKIEELFALKIKGYPVEKVLVEQKLAIEKESYLSITLDKQNNCPIFIASPEGGVDIERIAKEHPEKITRVRIDLVKGVAHYEMRKMAKALGMGKELFPICRALYTIFMDCDANLVEINPLTVTGNGAIAADAKMVIDNKASYRQKIFSQIEREEDKLKKMAEEHGLSTYIELDGDIGLISDGAGTGMLTLDLISDHGGAAANFSELGGVTDANTIKNAMEVVSSNPSVSVLLISMIGGLNRMDEMAEGIIAFFEEHDPIPIVIRMCGTREDVGKKMMREKGFPTTDNLYDAVKQAVELSRRC